MGRLSLVVAEKIIETADTCSLRLKLPEDAAEPFDYQPGQFVHVRGTVNGAEVERSYSISSTPALDPYLQLTIKRIDGGALSPLLVEQVAPGAMVEVSEPQGRFFEAPEDTPHHFLLVGAGSGVTPLYSILRWLLLRGAGHEVTLIYASRHEDGIIFRNALERLIADHPDALRVVHVLTRPSDAWMGERGRLDRARLAEILSAHAPHGNLPEIAYLCGPTAFMDEAATALSERGLADRDIRRESYEVAEAVNASELDDARTVRILPEGADKNDAPSAPCESVTVCIDGEEHDISVEPQETLLSALQRAGVDAPFSCQEGTCLSCMCRVEAGALRMKRHELLGLTPDDLGEGIALACLSRPDSARGKVSFEDV